LPVKDLHKELLIGMWKGGEALTFEIKIKSSGLDPYRHHTLADCGLTVIDARNISRHINPKFKPGII
tara:strand:- start:2368 stop:2568 length:201 start_codon:yes stop_codon:yes gene_type:complete